jgi:hypothetical protein
MAIQPKGQWKGVHLMAPRAEDVRLLNRAIEQTLAPLGVNVLILEVNYGFEYRSHPELRANVVLSKGDIRSILSTCRQNGVRLIPQFNCLGHQSWEKTTFPLLVKYPEFDETPHIPLDNPDIYCRSWCPLHPKVNDVVFALMDELIDAFEADAFHVGMDEVFLIANDQCRRCRGKNPADLFAKAVNDYHQHLVKKRQLTMLMWGDRLLDDSVMKYGKWEASQNGTAPAVDRIPKDIIICDWHYELRNEYPSVPFFQQKGFRVLPSSWRHVQAALALRDYARKNATEKMIGHLCTTWSSGSDTARALLNDPKASDSAKQAVQALREVMQEG